MNTLDNLIDSLLAFETQRIQDLPVELKQALKLEADRHGLVLTGHESVDFVTKRLCWLATEETGQVEPNQLDFGQYANLDES
ncbi:MAG: hypothetical protein CEO22_480 [Candidatus Berkelbacteria bacterium Gr01-1014_85]|uniref:Uncharacterized protein n=1 Tax=Candidatus Berkelbacteria bacterium Gr01-1014_85 TaxID=2017150 RepID=A0A554JAQ5_9BACT|nr:MAG: hypothetical protein CEO22_480 [Candidatus Berkelbacteria bacterium Gr01-1014_85]